MVDRIPSGTRDVLPDEMRELRAMTDRIRAVFERAGYGEVYTPALEYEDTFTREDRQPTHSHAWANRPAYRLFDEQGNVLVLRPDMTTPIARLAATRYAHVEPPFRFGYFAHTYRGVRPQRGQSRELLQAGVELIGSAAPEGTAEILSVLCSALDAAGLETYRVGVGDASLYPELLAATCHRRGAHALGGMAALIPSRRDEEANAKALDAVRADKRREVSQGYDGTWVAHPDLVPVARKVFEDGLEGAPNQLRRLRDDVEVSAAELLDLPATPGSITERGLRTDVNVGFQYVSFWLTGRGAAAINSLMEDAATAEISRSQIWQWVHHGAKLDDGRVVTPELVRQTLDEETDRIRQSVGEEVWRQGRPAETREVFERVALAPELIEFLTIPAYGYLD